MKDKGFASTDVLQQNRDNYVQSMKNHPNVKVMDNIIVQYGGGNMMKPGSYDRYTPFKNNPEADFIVIAWPLGLVQASCNPFKKDRALKGVNLGEIKDEVLSKWESSLKQREVPLSTIKWVSENKLNPESVGFTFKDFEALYGEKFGKISKGPELLNIIGNIMEKPYNSLSDKQKSLLEKVTVNAWDIIQSNSGGHKCITNISGLSYLGKNPQKSFGGGSYQKSEEDSPSVKFTKMIQNEFVRVLQQKIQEG
jgi:hypothetical protein